MSAGRIFILTALTMCAFASNSILCRLALKETSIDAASFTGIRIVSGAIALWLIVIASKQAPAKAGSWFSALALFVYAAGFSFAYLSLSAGTGALLLFGAVQATMIIWGLWKGERLSPRQSVGVALALGGLVVLLFPNISAPSLSGSALMLGAGVAWGVYSLRGKSASDPISATFGNFFRAVPMALVLCIALLSRAKMDTMGIGYAILSGAIASGVGYAIWYTALPGLKATSAATVQLSVPALTAAGGILFLDEPMTLRLLFASLAILGGIALVVIHRTKISADAAS